MKAQVRLALSGRTPRPAALWQLLSGTASCGIRHALSARPALTATPHSAGPSLLVLCPGLPGTSGSKPLLREIPGPPSHPSPYFLLRRAAVGAELICLLDWMFIVGSLALSSCPLARNLPGNGHREPQGQDSLEGAAEQSWAWGHLTLTLPGCVATQAPHLHMSPGGQDREAQALARTQRPSQKQARNIPGVAGRAGLRFHCGWRKHGNGAVLPAGQRPPACV